MNDVQQVTPVRHMRVPVSFVDAVRITATNFLAVAEWAEGTIRNRDTQEEITDFAGFNPSEHYIKISNPSDKVKGRALKGYLGDWITRNDAGGLKVFPSEEFQQTFMSVNNCETIIGRLSRGEGLSVEEQDDHAAEVEKLKASFRADDVPEAASSHEEQEREKTTAEDAELEARQEVERTYQTERDDTEQVGESAVMTTPGELATSGKPNGTVESSLTEEQALEVALEATGVKTTKTTVGVLDIGEEFVYNQELRVVVIKNDTAIVAHLVLTETQIEQGVTVEDTQVVFYCPDLGMPEGGVNWDTEVIVEVKEEVASVEDPHRELPLDPVAGEGEDPPCAEVIDVAVIELDKGDHFTWRGAEYHVTIKDDANIVAARDADAGEVVAFYNPEKPMGENDLSWNEVVSYGDSSEQIESD